MAIGVPSLFPFAIKDEAISLPLCSDADIRAIDKIRSILPQETETTHRLPWYTFVDEAMLVLADELMIITSMSKIEEVDFDAMLGERPSFFDRVKITSKVKPKESMVPSDFPPATPLPSSFVAIPQVRPILKRIASAFPTIASKSSKKTVPSKKASKVLARDSEEIETHSQGVGSQVGLVIPKATAPTMVMEAPSPTPIALPPAATPEEEVCHREGKPAMLAYDGKYLETPFQIPNLKVSLNSPWNARKFHYHLTRPLLSKKKAAQYKPLRDPYAALAQSMKHAIQAVNGTHILGRRADHLARVNSALECQLKYQKKAFSHKNILIKGLDNERTNLKTEFEAVTTTVEERVEKVDNLVLELAKEKEVAQDGAKSWDIERAKLISKRDALLARYNELEQAKAADALRATEALDKTNKDRDAALASVASVQFVRQKIREFVFKRSQV
ncbi:hypothetical protein LIER_43416 [Lithospermum erythrorhizon]|uniref:Uncharacterized protein n=1 Tax=Lithospermum erythrorhizon TaxID=34254 RepID=A0AAV3Q681_LITER